MANATIEASSPPTAYLGDNFEVVPEPGSTKLVIYLSATGMPPRQFNFWRPGNAVRTHRMFANNSRAWYQGGIPGLGASVRETVGTILAWAEFLGAKEIYTVGGSMGGYGAALFGCLLKARVLAFSWESELDLEGSRSRKLMDPGTTITFRDLRPLIADTVGPVFNLIGERDAVDAFSMSRLADLPNVRTKTMKGILHGPQNYLHRRERLVPLINDFVNNFDDLPDMPENGDMLARTGFPELFFRTHQHHAARRWRAAVDTGRQALRLAPLSEQCNWLVGHSLLALKRAAKAYPYLCAARHARGATVDFHHSYAACLRRLGDHREAIRLYEASLSKWPQHANSHYSLGLSYLATGERDKARASFEMASQLAPNNTVFVARAARRPA